MKDNSLKNMTINTEWNKYLCVIIPTYNNAGTIHNVIIETSNYIPNIIVVNDGSTDSTNDILYNIDIPITIVSYAQNRGKGYALKEGFKKAIELGYKFAITIDSDGQHKPSDIPKLIKAEENNLGAIIIGSRNLKDKIISKGSVFANKFSNFWFFVQTAKYLPDTQTGFRLYPLDKIYWKNLITNRYESELELLVFAKWNNVPIKSVEIDVIYPPKEERVSHFRPKKDFLRISILNTILCFIAILYAYPYKLLYCLRTFIYTIYSILVFIFGSLFLTIYTSIIFFFFKKTEKNKMLIHKTLYKAANFVIKNIPGVKYFYNKNASENFEKPAIIISNHQSLLDLMCAMMMTPKMIILTNKWVWNNIIFGKLIRYAEFYPVHNGIEQSTSHLKELANRGYSILIYPEGTRSKDSSIQRFHRGAFYLAEELNLDIIPIFVHGAGDVLPKKGCYFKPGKIHLEVYERITPEDKSFGETFKERAINFEKYYKERYLKIKLEKYP